MSDTLRKDFSTKAEEAVKPDSQKSTLDKAKETFTDKADGVAKEAQPSDEKSFTQKIGDTVSNALGGSK